MKLPFVCKFTHTYRYYDEHRERFLYALFMEYSKEKQAYYAILLEENGKFHGRNSHRWLRWEQSYIEETLIPMERLPRKVLNTVEDQISIFNEVNRRSRERITMSSL